MKSKYRAFYRRTLTLMEIMVVIVIIGLVSSVIAYNVRGSLNKGRVFKTEQAMNMLDDMICLEVPPDQIQTLIDNPKKTLESIGLAKDVKKLLVDGWGSPFEITRARKANSVRIHSKHLDADKDHVVELAGTPSGS